MMWRKKTWFLFFSGGDNFSVIGYIADFLFPANSNYCIKLNLKEEDRQAFLSDDKNQVYLDFNSYL